jgi:AmmeMemoRadiSam system protein A/AmmeMemoRadiSam system protein B
MPIIAAYIVPHPTCLIPEIGGDNVSSTTKTIEAYKQIANEIASLAPDTIIISSPHAEAYSDYFQISDGSLATGSFKKFGAGNINFRVLYDEELAHEISNVARYMSFPCGDENSEQDELDHGTMVPLYFINQVYTSYKAIRLGLSGLPLLEHYEMGCIIQKAVGNLNRRVVYIASGDWSHCQKEDGPYGYREEGPRYDALLLKAFERANFGELFNFEPALLERAQECGHRSFTILAGALDRKSVESRVYSHEAPFGVGYGIVGFVVKGDDPSRAFADIYKNKIALQISEKRKNADIYVKLAYKVLDDYLLRGKMTQSHFGISHELLHQKAGVFVTIHEFGTLRGCVGTVTGSVCLADEITHNAIEAASKDNRFAPINKSELPYLDISIDVLSPLEDIKGLNELDPNVYGVVVSKGSKRGLLLPNLPGIKTVEEQVRIAKQKADIEFDEEVSLQRFTVVRHQ